LVEALSVAKYGADLQNDPLLNKGTCFTAEERRVFGLEGLMPPGIGTMEQQVTRVYDNYRRLDDDLQRYLFLTGLRDRNETCYYRVLIDHIDEMAPIVYTPTVGLACQTYSRIYRRPRGVYITPAHRGRIAEVLRRAAHQNVRVIVATDNEAILGLGDLGVGGMGIPIGKLSLYTAGAGIHPACCLAVDLDVGTNNQALLDDPLYLGVRAERLRGEPYFELLDEFVEAVLDVHPRALVQWEDFSSGTAFEVLARYRDVIPSFNDDIQGTGAVVVAGVLGGIEQAGRSLADERFVFLGAGASGGGCATALRTALGAADLDPSGRVLCLDSRGLITVDRPQLDGHKRDLAVSGWTDGLSLSEVVARFKPTVMLGMSGQPGAFSEEIVRTMHAHCTRPVIFPLSNPTSRAEATPADLAKWTGEDAIVATGSPFAGIAQVNNVLIFPGVGLGAIASDARVLPDETFLAAAEALAEASGVEPRLFPELHELRAISRRVAGAVARSLSGLPDQEVERRLDALMWNPEYRPYIRV